MNKTATTIVQSMLEEIRQSGVIKTERVLTTPQGAEVQIQGDRSVLNFCANNYLGLANHPDVIAAAQTGLAKYGFGLASGRFICGTQTIHQALEAKISTFLRTEATILYTSCFDANGGIFETLLDGECAVISDALNHASIIDGIRLCKAQRHRYAHSDMRELEACLQATQAAKIRLIATDGVFSMDGEIAKLEQICDLADTYDALVMVDDSHGTGVLGAMGRGSIEHCQVMGRVDVITSTLGKALGGASGGFTSGHQAIIDLLRQRSRPYLFSNTLAPMIAYTSITVLEMIEQSSELRDRLMANTQYFRQRMSEQRFDIKAGVHPITPIMLYDAKPAQDMAQDLFEQGIYVVGFSHPVVPQGQARIRVQLSASHTRSQIDRCVEAFTQVAKKYGKIPI